MTNHIPTEIVMRPVRERLQCYRLCSAEAVRRGRAVRGIVVTQFVIDVDGWVRTSHVRSNDTGDDALGECIAHQFVGLRYPEPDGGRFTIVYPMTVDTVP